MNSSYAQDFINLQHLFWWWSSIAFTLVFCLPRNLSLSSNVKKNSYPGYIDNIGRKL